MLYLWTKQVDAKEKYNERNYSLGNLRKILVL